MKILIESRTWRDEEKNNFQKFLSSFLDEWELSYMSDEKFIKIFKEIK